MGKKFMLLPVLIGIGAAFLAAICQSVTDVCTKLSTRNAENFIIVPVQWATASILLLFLCAISWFFSLSQLMTDFFVLTRPNFLILLFGTAALNVLAYNYYVRAFEFAEATQVAPFVLLTPIFTLFTSSLMLKEFLPPSGIFGVITSALGLFLFAFRMPGSRIINSIFIFYRNKGMSYMIIASLIWSITANLDKLGIEASSPLTWITSLTSCVSLMSFIVWFIQPRKKVIYTDIRYAIFAGLTSATGNVLQMYALTHLFVPYVIAIKRVSVFFTLVASRSIFNEKISGRLLGVSIIYLGLIMIVFSIV